jgi:hypothetical protein
MTQPQRLLEIIGYIELDLDDIDCEFLDRTIHTLLDKFSEEYFRSRHANNLAYLQAEGLIEDSAWVRTTRQNLKFYLEKRIREAAS